MCTLTFIRTAEAEIITANRDESPHRRASGLSEYRNGRGQVFYIAKEPLHGGTNLAIGVNHTSVLLNGAFAAHERLPPYPKSRGILMLESLEYQSLAELPAPDKNQVEPFTLIRFGSVIEILRWDHERLHFQSQSKGADFIVASAQLYSNTSRENRRLWFKEFLSSFNGDPDSVFDFHLHGGNGDEENDMVMSRTDLVRTVSVSQVVKSRPEMQVRHLDLIGGKEEKKSLHLNEIR